MEPGKFAVWRILLKIFIQYRGDSQLLRLHPGPGTSLHHGHLQRAPAEPGVQPGLQLLQDHPELQQEDDVPQPPGALLSGTDIAQVCAAAAWWLPAGYLIKTFIFHWKPGFKKSMNLLAYFQKIWKCSLEI